MFIQLPLAYTMPDVHNFPGGKFDARSGTFHQGSDERPVLKMLMEVE